MILAVQSPRKIQMTHSREKRECVMNKNLLTTKTITVMKTEEKKAAAEKAAAEKAAAEKGMDLLSLIFGYPSHEQCVINHKKAMGK